MMSLWDDCGLSVVSRHLSIVVIAAAMNVALLLLLVGGNFNIELDLLGSTTGFLLQLQYIWLRNFGRLGLKPIVLYEATKNIRHDWRKRLEVRAAQNRRNW